MFSNIVFVCLASALTAGVLMTLVVIDSHNSLDTARSDVEAVGLVATIGGIAGAFVAMFGLAILQPIITSII